MAGTQPPTCLLPSIFQILSCIFCIKRPWMNIFKQFSNHVTCSSFSSSIQHTIRCIWKCIFFKKWSKIGEKNRKNVFMFLSSSKIKHKKFHQSYCNYTHLNQRGTFNYSQWQQEIWVHNSVSKHQGNSWRFFGLRSGIYLFFLKWKYAPQFLVDTVVIPNVLCLFIIPTH